ncbi:MAG: c-type heme family protein [Myxococcota bacterium]
MTRRLVALLAVVVCGAGAASVGADEPGAAERGSELLAPFKRELQQALREGLAKGPAEAIDACRERAPEIARARSRDGVRMGRASHRLRNPANAAPEWVAPTLAAYLEEDSERAPRVVAIGEGWSGYVEPILTQPLCLTCHGEALAPEVAERIAALYPEDRAVGFRVGELRGVFWVEYPAAD